MSDESTETTNDRLSLEQVQTNEESDDKYVDDEESKTNLSYLERLKERELHTYEQMDAFLSVGGCSGCRAVGIHKSRCPHCELRGDPLQYFEVLLPNYNAVLDWVERTYNLEVTARIQRTEEQDSDSDDDQDDEQEEQQDYTHDHG